MKTGAAEASDTQEGKTNVSSHRLQGSLGGGFMRDACVRDPSPAQTVGTPVVFVLDKHRGVGLLSHMARICL